MQKSLLVLIPLAAILAACGGGNGGSPTANDNPVESLPANTLQVNGQDISKKVLLQPQAPELQIIAPGNGPIRMVRWLSADNSTTARVSAAQFLLDPDKQQFLLQQLIEGENRESSKDRIGLTGLVCESKVCANQTSYTLQTGRTESLLQLRFNAGPYSFLNGQDLQDVMNGAQPPFKPVTVNGQLNFHIPANWPILKASRFPAVDIGSFIFGGQPYQVVDALGPAQITYNFSLKADEYQLVLKQGDQLSRLYFTLETQSTPPYDKAYLRFEAADKQVYRASLALPQTNWSSTAEGINVSFDNVMLAEEKSGQHKILKSSVFIPKPVAGLNSNGQALALQRIDSSLQGFEASAGNDRQWYRLLLKDGQHDVYLTLITELDGRITAQLGAGEQLDTCGNNSGQYCSGLTLAADKKTYRFKNVVIGSRILNGTLFIPGVFG